MTHHTIRIPFEVREETYDNLLAQAYQSGAIPYRDGENGLTTFDLTFATKKAADDFAAKLPKVYEVEHLGPHRDFPVEEQPIEDAE